MDWYAGVDVSKQTLQLSVWSPEGEWIVAGNEEPNNEEGFCRLAQQLGNLEGTGCLGLEATGGYEEPLMIWFSESTEIPVTRLNPYQVKSFGKAKLLRAKTDPVDAKTIAHFMSVQRPEPSEPPNTTRHEIRKRARHLDHLKDRRAQAKTYKESLDDSLLEDQVEETIRHYDRQIEQLERQLEDDVKTNEQIQKTVEYVASITSVGDYTARGLILEMKDGLQPERIDPKTEVAHSGIAPEIKQSGKWKGKSKMSKTGNARIRKLLYFPTLNAINHNPVIKRYYEKLMSKGKKKMVAVVACMRKLLHLVVGVIKNQTHFDPDWEAKRT